MNSSFWSRPVDQVVGDLGSTLNGLPSTVAATRSPNSVQVSRSHDFRRLLLAQFSSPIQALLIIAAGLSFALGDTVDSLVILTIILASGLLSFQHEYRAGNAVAKLIKLVATTCTVLRDGQPTTVPLDKVVSGDVALLSAGSIVPGDGLAIESQLLYVDEAALTGESFPVEKRPGVVSTEATLAQRTNSLFAGSHVVSGQGRMLVVSTGSDTELGGIAQSLRQQKPSPDFEIGVRRFGYMLVQLTLMLTLVVFGINVFLHRPVLESFMFALALAVGLTPQLLPAIISVNLARGAVSMAASKLITKRLSSIESFGSMDVLCSDKTGTLTTGTVSVFGTFDADNQSSDEVLRLCRINACLQTGFRNPIDSALAADLPDGFADQVDLLDEIPYEFVRKRLSVLIQAPQGVQLITKGALAPILEVCEQARVQGAKRSLELVKPHIESIYHAYSEGGYRVLGVASRDLNASTRTATPALEAAMCFEGFLVLEDPLRPEIAHTVARLKAQGIELKVITGDNRLVAERLAQILELDGSVLSGADLKPMSETALRVKVASHSIFAEIEPNQKERIIRALKHAGHVVGFIGDGINDGAALHAADVSISVANAVDVAKEAADFVMLEPSLEVLVDAVGEGRRTFANTMKYIFMATSANFGNMFSLAGASLLVPFLPLLPKQVLVMNLLTDVPEMTIAGDTVDPEMVAAPQRWDLAFLRRFMIVFGILSSVFDFTTFLTLLALKTPAAEFRTAWFTESIISATLIVLVVRSRRPFFRSKPGKGLTWATLAVVLATIGLPNTELGTVIGLSPLPWHLIGLVAGIVLAYVVSAEIVKAWFFRKQT